jgi:hypothetical protein
MQFTIPFSAQRRVKLQRRHSAVSCKLLALLSADWNWARLATTCQDSKSDDDRACSHHRSSTTFSRSTRSKRRPCHVKQVPARLVYQLCVVYVYMYNCIYELVCRNLPVLTSCRRRWRFLCCRSANSRCARHMRDAITCP